MQSKTKPNRISDALKLAALLRPSWPTINARIAASGVPTCHVAEASLKDRLQEIQAAKASARNEHAACKQAMDQARAAVARLKVSPAAMTSTSEWKGAEAAKAQLEAASEKLSQITDAENGVLQLLGRGQSGGGGNGPRSGEGGGNAWEQAARELGVKDGRRDRIDGAADSFLTPPRAAGFKVSPGEGLSQPSYLAPFIEQAMDLRFLYPSFTRTQLDPGDLAIHDFKQTGSRTVEGEVERDPVSTDEKAQLALEVTLETPALRQFAVVVDGVPVKLLEAEEALRAFLENEMRYQVNIAVDEHCMAQIAAATPAKGETGTTLIEKVRNGVSAMRALGAVPTILALSPTDAAALDTMKTGTAGLETYVFVGEGQEVGSVPSLFGLAVLELPHIVKPMLIDPVIAGVFYSAQGSLLIDPYSGMSKNTVRLRWEADGLLHIRDISGIRMIDKP